MAKQLENFHGASQQGTAPGNLRIFETVEDQLVW